MTVTAHDFYNAFGDINGVREKLEQHLIFQEINLGEAISLLSSDNNNNNSILTALSFKLANLYIEEHHPAVTSALCKATCLFIERLELENLFSEVIPLFKLGAEQSPNFKQAAQEKVKYIQESYSNVSQLRKYSPEYVVYNVAIIILNTSLDDGKFLHNVLFTNILGMQMPAAAEMRISPHERYKLMEKGNVVSKDECYTLMKEALEEAAKK